MPDKPQAMRGESFHVLIAGTARGQAGDKVFFVTPVEDRHRYGNQHRPRRVGGVTGTHFLRHQVIQTDRQRVFIRGTQDGAGEDEIAQRTGEGEQRHHREDAASTTA